VNSTTEKSSARLSFARFLPREEKSARELMQTAWIVCDQAVVSLASFASTVIVGRVSGREALGIYVLATTTFWLLVGIPNALTWTPFTSRAPRMSTGRRASYCGSITIHTVLLTLVLAAICVVTAARPPRGPRPPRSRGDRSGASVTSWREARRTCGTSSRTSRRRHACGIPRCARKRTSSRFGSWIS